MKIILMADIVGSSKRKAKTLMQDFKKIVAHTNTTGRANILSPLTITLGDEFQGVIKNPNAAIQIIFELEQQLLSLKKTFKLRYIIQEGEIETKLNKERAYEMLGPGLTEAREKLMTMKSTKQRFHVSLRDKDMSEKLNLMLIVLQGITDKWTPVQQKIVAAFLEFGDYRNVARKLKRDPTTVWRRRKSLMIEEFASLKKLMLLTTAHK
jgi:hypothetical protein